MLNRRYLVVSVVLVLLVAVLAGCGAGAAMLPDREVTVSIDEALAAQDAAMAGLLTGQAEWTESQFSSLVTELIKQNLGAGAPVQEVKAWFTPEGIVVAAALADGSQVVLAGDVMVENNRVKLDLKEAAAMGMVAAGPVLDMVEGAINRALDAPELGVAVAVDTGDGTLSLGLGQ